MDPAAVRAPAVPDIWLIGLPWNVATDDQLDLKEAARILEEDHYGPVFVLIEAAALRVTRPR